MLGLGILGELGLDGDELGELVGGVGRLGDPELLGGDGMLGDDVDEGEGGVGIEVLLWLAQAPNARDANKIRLVLTRIACLPGDPGIKLEVLYYSPERTSLAPAAAPSAASGLAKKGTRGVPGYSELDIKRRQSSTPTAGATAAVVSFQHRTQTRRHRVAAS